MSSYEYSPLDSARSEIRVLALRPSSKPDDAFHCSLRTVSLDDKPHFEALSYVWGTPTPTQNLFVDGVAFPVGPSLFAALHALRSRKRDRVVWADAICINQKSVEDKNYQVPLMGRIYSQAARTVIWFGPSNVDVDALMSWLLSHDSVSARLKLGAKTLFSEKSVREKDMRVVKAATGYWDLLARPYWYRMWTFQEFLLPGDDPLCLCGTHEFTMPQIDEVKDRLIGAINDVGYRLNKQLASEGRRPDQDKAFLDSAEAITKQLRAMSGKSTEARSGANVFKIRKAYRTESRSLAYFLGMTMERQCFMEQDHFYAMYGILPALQSAAPLDYNKSVRQVVLELSSYIINVEDTKNVYENFGLRPDHLESSSEVPSWVPDYYSHAGPGDADSGPGQYTKVMPRAFSEDALRGAPRTRVEDLATLRIHGFAAGAVVATRRFPTATEGIFAELHALLSGEAYGSSPALEPRKRSTRAPRLAAASESYVRGKTGWDDAVSKDFAQAVEELRCQHSAGQMPERHLVNFKCFAGRTTFITDTGLIGLGVSHIREGDVVSILKRESTPVVLRSAPGDGSRRWQMVGTAYIDGLMDNEWFDEELLARLRKQSPSEFCII